MLHARMIRPPVAGAVPVNVDDSAIKDIPGAKSVWIKDLLAVVAEKEWNAVKAAQGVEGDLVGVDAELPGPRQAARPHPQGADRQAQDPARERQRRGGPQAGRAHHRRRVRIPDPVARQHGAGLCGRRRARRRGDDLDLDAEALRFRQPASPNCSDCRTTRCTRSGCSAPAPMAATTRATPPPTRRCCQSISADRCACSTCAHEQLGWDPKGTASVNRSRAGLDASGKVIAYENISKAFSRTDTNTRESRAADVLAGHLLGCRSSRSRISKSRSRPTRSITAGSAGK